MMTFPYENVLPGVEPRALRVVCRPRHDAPPWQETLLRHAYENDVAFCGRAQAVAGRIERTVGRCSADVVIRCIYDMPAVGAVDVDEIDTTGNVLSMLWWLLHSPRVPRQATYSALGTLCRVYGWKRRSMTLVDALKLPRPDIPTLPCVPLQVH